MQRLKLILAFLFLATCSATLTSASTLKLAAEVQKLMPSNDRPVSDTKFKELSTAIWAYWESYASRIPRNSPAELKWLNAELNSHDNARIGAILNRREYALFLLLNLANECRQTSNAIAFEFSADKAWYMLQWVKMLNCFVDGDMQMNKLKRAELVKDTSYGGDFHIGLFGVWTNNIINYVIPSIYKQN